MTSHVYCQHPTVADCRHKVFEGQLCLVHGVCANCTDAGKGESVSANCECGGEMQGVESLLNLACVLTWDKCEDCGPSWPLLQAAFLVKIQGLVPMPALTSQFG